jgi:hypothetical protein
MVAGGSDMRLSGGAHAEEPDEEQLRTLWCGGLNEKVTEEVLYELFLNAGPLERVTIPKDRETKQQKNFGFIVFEHEESVKFAYDLLNGVELHRGKIRLQNKTTGLGLDSGRGGRDGPGHHRSFSTPGPPTSGSSRQWAGQQQPRTPPSYPPAGYGGYGHMSQMSPMGYQVPYGYPQANGRERDYGRERRDDYSRADPRDDYNRRGSGGGPSPRYDQGRERDRPYDSRDRYHRR